MLAIQRAAGNRAVSAALANRRQPSGDADPLPASLRTQMEASFGTSFADVRLHRDASPRDFGAVAVTRGQDIHVTPEAYEPGSLRGRELLGHELAHVVQQRQSKVSTMGKGGFTVDPALEAEADRAGEQAAAGRRVDAIQTKAPQSSLGRPPLIQPKLGFELELETLVDVGGRPAPSKSFLGSYGAHHLELQVDQNAALDGPAPVHPRRADFTVGLEAPDPAGVRPTRTRQYEAFDLPSPVRNRRNELVSYESRIQGGNPWEALPSAAFTGWQADTSTAPFARPGVPSSVGLHNGLLPALDKAVVAYLDAAASWDSGEADRQLGRIEILARNWLDANNDPPFVWRPEARRHYLQARDTVTALGTSAGTHRAFWQAPANVGPRQREYRRTVAGVSDPWSLAHPTHAGGERYASILEIVTRPYEPETAAGRADIVASMTEAVQLAHGIQAATGNFARRERLNTVAGTNLISPETFVGNGEVPNQGTDASIQSTFAVDLSQIPSFIWSTVATLAPQSRFSLKHQADTEMGARSARTNRAEVELYAAVRDATTIAKALQARYTALGRVAPELVNFRGLLTLVCSYLRMGRYFFAGGSPLDKNLTDLLSRTDLAVIRSTVPAPEGACWRSLDGLRWLRDQILAQTGRNGDGALFNNESQTRALGGEAPYDLTCKRFIGNVFTTAQDGVTGNLGGFKKLPAESVDPNRNRPGAEAGREAPVFELRNMIPKTSAAAEAVAGGEIARFPATEWVGLAQYFADMFALLNARTEAQAVRDVRIRNTQAGVTSAIAAPANWSV